VYGHGVPPIPNSAIRRAKLRKASPQIRAWVAAFEQFMREHDLEKALQLEPGSLSRHLGFVPVPPDGDA
jgi:hypothetical protein